MENELTAHLKETARAMGQAQVEQLTSILNQRCILRVGHPGPHMFVNTKSTVVLLGECAARPKSQPKAEPARERALPENTPPCANCGLTAADLQHARILGRKYDPNYEPECC